MNSDNVFQADDEDSLSQVSFGSNRSYKEHRQEHKERWMVTGSPLGSNSPIVGKNTRRKARGSVNELAAVKTKIGIGRTISLDTNHNDTSPQKIKIWSPRERKRRGRETSRRRTFSMENMNKEMERTNSQKSTRQQHEKLKAKRSQSEDRDKFLSSTRKRLGDSQQHGGSTLAIVAHNIPMSEAPYREVKSMKDLSSAVDASPLSKGKGARNLQLFMLYFAAWDADSNNIAQCNRTSNFLVHTLKF